MRQGTSVVCAAMRSTLSLWRFSKFSVPVFHFFCLVPALPIMGVHSDGAAHVRGFRGHELSEIHQIVIEHRQFFLEKWHAYFGRTR